MNIAVTQDLISSCLHYLTLQAKVAQEKLDYIRRREARELSELNAKKEQEKSAASKNKTEKAIVRLFSFFLFISLFTFVDSLFFAFAFICVGVDQ